MRISDWRSDVCASDLGAGSQTRRAIKATSRQKPSRRLSARRRSSRSKAFRLKKPCSLRGQPAKGGSPPEYRASAFGSMLSISRLSDGGELLTIEISDRYPFHDDGRADSRLEGSGRFPIRCGAKPRRDHGCTILRR